MMRIEEPSRFVREMKGAPLSILVLLMMTRQAMSNQLVVGGTGYSDKTVAAGLDYLEQIGMVVRAAGGWRIAEGVQLALPMGEERLNREEREVGEDYSADGEYSVGEEVQEGDNSDTNGDSRKISAFSPLVSIDSNILINQEVLTTNYLGGEEAEKFRLNLLAMAECGIRRTRKTEELARRDYVDALYILAHAEAVKREGQQVGLAIWRMGEGQERPLGRKENVHFEGCKCDHCRYAYPPLEVMGEAEEWDWWLSQQNCDLSQSCVEGAG